MFKTIKSTLARDHALLVQDLLGVVALIVLLLSALHQPLL
ncbi:hypothetical protein SAMN04487993_103143 [Salipiger marinus]|uniref:Uncharacterized protein n=1 Tax=Salipiger marinus TaxID=555512 RepID=A0A1G8TQ46_9RHOB|nr:hypothetical protein SAMN04487993_103143 [Salipiger marinus]